MLRGRARRSPLSRILGQRRGPVRSRRTPGSHRLTRHSAEWPAQMPYLRANSSRPCSDALRALTPRPAARLSVAPPWLIMKHRQASRRLVQCLALLQQLRRIGQAQVRADCLRAVLVLVQNQESLGSVFRRIFGFRSRHAGKLRFRVMEHIGSLPTPRGRQSISRGGAVLEQPNQCRMRR